MEGSWAAGSNRGRAACDPQVQEHDSLQYHFFFPGLFVAARVFHTASLQHHSAWLCTTDDGAAAG